MALNEQQRKIMLVVACYFVISISLVFVNKVLLSTESVSIPAPMFITWYQCVVTALICWVLGIMGRGAPEGTFLAQFPEPSFEPSKAIRIMPLSICFIGMITFNNLCLKYVEVSFYNVARSLTMCFNVVFTFFILGVTTSKRSLVAVAVVTVVLTIIDR